MKSIRATKIIAMMALLGAKHVNVEGALLDASEIKPD